MSIRSLKIRTRKFFSQHWLDNEIGIDPPVWSGLWDLKGPMPNHDKQGVYAFLKEGSVTYIGVGAGKGKAGYEGYGLGPRVNSQYMRLNQERNGYYAIDQKLDGADGIVTIGFPEGFGYLAVALEQFLISRLDPIDNIVRAGS